MIKGHLTGWVFAGACRARAELDQGANHQVLPESAFISVNLSAKDLTRPDLCGQLMAASLEIPVIAEGIEDRQQAELLVELGCGYVQGFFYGRPSPWQDMAGLAWFDRKRRHSEQKDGPAVTPAKKPATQSS